VSKLRIAVDYQSAEGRKTGIGVFASNLFRAISRENCGIEFLQYSTPINGRDLTTPQRICWESGQIPMRLLRDKPDLVYSPGFAPPMFSPTRRVVTVHDLIGVLWPSNQKGFSGLYWRSWLPAAMKKAHRIAASSESTRGDILRLLRVPESRVRVVPLCVDPCFRQLPPVHTPSLVLRRHGLAARPFYLSVGTLEPRKNYLRLLQAYLLLAVTSDPGFDLVIIGKPAGADRELHDFVAEKRLGDKIKFLGYVDNEELVELYNSAIGYVTVSLFEGFGLPALEAMSCGKSGIVSNRTSLPEVAGSTALMVNPEQPAEIADALRMYASDSALRERMGGEALARSRQFTPQRMARAMIEIFKEAAE
jgi:glycosyltransferase involved in cell wall biosynthesis